MTHMLSQSSRESLAKHALTQGGERCTRSVLLATTNLGTHRVESVTERAARPHKNIMYSNASCNISARISSALIMRTFAAGSLAWATQCIFERGGRRPRRIWAATSISFLSNLERTLAGHGSDRARPPLPREVCNLACTDAAWGCDWPLTVWSRGFGTLPWGEPGAWTIRGQRAGWPKHGRPRPLWPKSVARARRPGRGGPTRRRRHGRCDL